jgi:ABC-type transport system involved in multi-copper enzyme maturation permease subunit
MSGFFLLFMLSLKRARTLLVATGLLLAVFQVLLVLIAGSVHNAGEFDAIASMLPPFVRGILGPSLTSVMSFKGVVCVGYIDLAIMVAFLALTIAQSTTPAAEIENGFADLILARPFARHWIITRTIALVAVSVVLMLLMMMIGTWIGLTLLSPADAEWPTARLVGSLSLNLAMLMFCWSGISMALGAIYRRSAASATAGLLALLTLLLDFIGQIWTPAGRISWLSPFHYLRPFELIMGQAMPWENLAVLWAIGMTGFTLAYYWFSQRDISR